MPELPEVENIARGLRSRLLGKRCEDLEIRFGGVLRPSPEEVRRTLQGKVLQRVHRHGKYLLLTFRGPVFLMIHLRMTGQIFLDQDYQPDKHVHLIFDFSGRRVFYRDIRKFGRLELVDDGILPGVMSHIGPDYLEISYTEWQKRVRKQHRPWKAVLLDQGIAAGLGNIYVDESLFRARLHPARKPVDTSPRKLRELFAHIVSVLRESIEAGGTTYSDFIDFSGKPGNFKEQLQVYNRRGEPCFRCGTTISHVRLAGRGTSFCPRCQKP